jgi:endonuclease YncB( thermonuclease family)
MPKRQSSPRGLLLTALLLLAACGPQIGSLQRGEQGRVVRAINGDTLQLESGLRVFLAEIDAPRGDEPYASQAQAELEALALHRTALLAYGGARRWTARARPGDTQPPASAAIAHVFVQSEGGRWFWLQNVLVAHGAAMVRPGRDNHARTAELLALEAQARAAQRGLWAKPDYRPLGVRRAAALARAFDQTCTNGRAPYRIVQGAIHDAQVFERRASLALEADGQDDPAFAIAVFGDSFTRWDGPPLASLSGARVRVRGALGVFHGQPQLCVDDSRQIEVLRREVRRLQTKRAGLSPGPLLILSAPIRRLRLASSKPAKP